MISVLVVIAGVVVAEAGITHQPPGLRLHYNPASSYLGKPVLKRSQIANPIGVSPALSYAPGIPSTIFSPIVYSSVKSYPASLLSFPNTLKLNSAPIRHVAIGPTSTITQLSPHIVLRPASLGPVLSSPVLSSAPISQTVIKPAAITYLPQPTVLSPTSINHAEIEHTISSTQKTHNPIKNNGIIHEVQQLQEVEKSISYSLSEKDYEYLKRHKTEGKDSPYNPDSGLDTVSPSEKHHNTHSHNGEGNEKSHKSSDTDNVLKRSAAPNEIYQELAKPMFVNSPEPLVVKHIYFHVPQPDFEEPPPVPINVSLQKKTYNILFIKAPAQEQDNHAYLQQLLLSRQPQIEDKTLIYVLSKKQDPVVVLPPQQVRPSRPEVYFLKYKSKLGDITDIRHELVQESFIERSPLQQNRCIKDSQIDSEPEKKISDEIDVHSIT